MHRLKQLQYLSNMRDMNVKCAAESVWQQLSMKCRHLKLSECVGSLVCVCCESVWVCRNACACRSMMVGESAETGNYPRLQLIHILSSVLAQGSRVICECDRHTCTHTHTENESIWCMLDRFMVQDYEHLTSPLGSRSRSQVGFRQYIQVESGIWCQEACSRCLSSLSLQADVAVHFSLKMINVHANYQSMGVHSNMGDKSGDSKMKNNIILPLILLHSVSSLHRADTHVIFSLISPPFFVTPSIY